jgi:hypothetical protein
VVVAAGELPALFIA